MSKKLSSFYFSPNAAKNNNWLCHMGLPLDQAQQEITSILTAQTDSSSVVAKSLGLNNDMIRRLTDQGKLYDFLNEKSAAFQEGDKLQS